MNYSKLFDPEKRAKPGIYVYPEDVTLAVNVALATGRPLLISGPSGCGKSTLAKDVADVLDYEYESEIITSKTEAVDLLYRVDHLRQLRDSHKELKARSEYVTPGVLWRAFDPAGSKTRTPSDPNTPASGKEVVVLIDEIDKADPDLPNNLLEPFGDYRFRVTELENIENSKIFEVSTQRRPLLIITTNNERRLPDAFLRRCVARKIERPKAPELVVIGRKHFAAAQASGELLETVAEAVEKLSSYSTAEYLDTIRAIVTLGIPESSDSITEMINITVRKSARELAE